MHALNTIVAATDFSAAADRAARRAARDRLAQVAGLARMDAERMAFPDARFDKVVAMYDRRAGGPHPAERAS